MPNHSNTSPDQSNKPLGNNITMVTQAQSSNILEYVRQSSLQLGSKLSLKQLSPDLLQFVQTIVTYDTIHLFVRDTDEINFTYQTSHPKLETTLERKLKKVYFNSFNAQNDPIIGQWLQGKSVAITDETIKDSQVTTLQSLIASDKLVSVPLMVNDQLYGILILKLDSEQDIPSERLSILDGLGPHLAIYLANAYTYESKVKELESGMHEARILSQIDEELNDTIQLPRVFRMIMDWALRFTNAHSAALAIYDEVTDNLRVMEHYGFELDNPQLKQILQIHKGGITHRAARNGQAEVIPDVEMDSDYRSINHQTRSQMSVPIMREERVEAIITLESQKFNAFTDEHLDFVRRLAQRAGVAVDNARLFTETEQERQKLELILSNIKDIVIVIGSDNHILLINQSALSGLSLHMTDESYVGLPFEDTIEHAELNTFYKSGIEKDQGMMEEMQLPNGRHYHAQISPLEKVGWVLVMQDITHFKETDKLKSELLATASHDLKQPLSVMRGYIDLLEMTNTFDERSERFLSSLNKAITNMQTLIDELLDLARIESGIELEMEEVDLVAILNECIDANMQKAREKSMEVHRDIPENVNGVHGDSLRLSQIFNNLVSNAIKYTPPEGEVRIYTETQGKVIRISVQDTGLGISPEDKAQIFDRFYRVRRPETDSIEGTGLGLAIVKSLVEAHQGEIALISKLNKGSTFHVTLPLDV